MGPGLPHTSTDLSLPEGTSRIVCSLKVVPLMQMFCWFGVYLHIFNNRDLGFKNVNISTKFVRKRIASQHPPLLISVTNLRLFCVFVSIFLNKVVILLPFNFLD